MSSVDFGELSFLRDHTKTRYAVRNGYAEVTSSRVTVLVERADEIDLERENGQRSD